MILSHQKEIDYYTRMGVWGDKTLVDVFRQNVERNPQRLALVDPLNKEKLVGLPAERLSYAELSHRVDALATALLAMNITKDDIVIVQLPNIWELSLAYMALARIGALFSPMPMQWREKEFNYICDLTQAKAYIGVESFAGFSHMEMAKKIQSESPSLKHLLALQELRKLSEGQANSPLLDKIEISANDVFSLCW